MNTDYKNRVKLRRKIIKLRGSMMRDKFGCCKRLYWNQMMKEEIIKTENKLLQIQ